MIVRLIFHDDLRYSLSLTISATVKLPIILLISEYVVMTIKYVRATFK